ncbi:MAG: T9SS type A sorting domain-containing protein [Flavobacteriales bacterium]|nr:T9SS type A sorting domain-containing protein [Flavobacteriales bacterium]
MKTLYYTLTLALFFSSQMGAQNITNGGFENWEVAEEFDSPVDWSNTDLEAGFFTSAISLSSDAVDGQNSVRLETIDETDDGIFGFVLAGEFGDDGPEGGFPFTGEVEGLRGHFKWDVQPGDSANIIMVAFNGGEMVEMAVEKLVGSEDMWTEIDMTFQSGAVEVDEVLVAVASSNALEDEYVEGSWVMVDDLTMMNGDTEIGGVPNGSFEEWEQFSYEEPVDWNTTAFIGISLVEQVSDAHSGDHAVMLENMYLEEYDEYAEAYLINGEFTEDGPVGGQDYTLRPEVINGYFKYNPQGTDTGFVHVQFWNESNLIGMAVVELFETSEYTMFSEEIMFFGNETPTHFTLVATPGNETGSVLYLDDLEFGGVTGLEEPQELEGIVMKVRPNPTRGDLTLYVSADLKITEILMYNAYGRVAFRQTGERFLGKGEPISLNLWGIDSGVYQLVLMTEQGIVTETVVKQ